MNIYGLTDKGLVRSSNQDAFAFGELSDGKHFAVVCDGMGGANGGNIASTMAVDNLSASLKSGFRANMSDSSVKNLLESAISAANVKVFDKSKMNAELRGMGTTVVAAVIFDNEVHIAHAGDSRAYILRNNELIQITRDHSIVQSMIEEGKLTPEEARFHPRKNVITRALGVEESVNPEFNINDLEQGDMLLLCTDGLSNYVESETIVQILKSETDPTGKLIALANENGGGDNITAVVVKID